MAPTLVPQRMSIRGGAPRMRVRSSKMYQRTPTSYAPRAPPPERLIAARRPGAGGFVIEVVEALFGAATFYYVARFVDSPQLRQTLPQGISYFAFTLVGFIFFDYLHAALDSFDRSLQEARDSSTLEPMLGVEVARRRWGCGLGRLSGAGLQLLTDAGLRRRSGR